MSRNDAQKDFMWGAIVGGSVATLVALLFTTKKGKQLQNQVISLYENIEESVKDTFAAAEEKVGEAVEKVGKQFANAREKATDIEEDIEDAGRRAAHKLKHEYHKDSK